MTEFAFPLQKVIAYRTKENVFPLVEAPAVRDWMLEDETKFSNRCLPLRVANGIGWFILNPKDVTVAWDGNEFTTTDSSHADTHFGNGIVTLNPGYLFRTDPGWGLWVKGVANAPKGILQNLEAVIETDQLPFAFGISLRFVIPGSTTIAAGAPIAQLVPVPLSAVAEAKLEIRDLIENPDLKAVNERWIAAREQITGSSRPWHGMYARGEGLPFPHQRIVKNRIDRSE